MYKENAKETMIDTLCSACEHPHEGFSQRILQVKPAPDAAADDFARWDHADSQREELETWRINEQAAGRHGLIVVLELEGQEEHDETEWGADTCLAYYCCPCEDGPYGN